MRRQAFAEHMFEQDGEAIRKRWQLADPGLTIDETRRMLVYGLLLKYKTKKLASVVKSFAEEASNIRNRPDSIRTFFYGG